MKDSHAEKGAHNQALIREVNERIVLAIMGALARRRPAGQNHFLAQSQRRSLAPGYPSFDGGRGLEWHDLLRGRAGLTHPSPARPLFHLQGNRHPKERCRD